ncbi:putative leucine rich repeat domain-containing protein [Phaeoacremonium minimum UCRPA7]|uniref:Putative leucine rich repeat domain-containing protein n=1 Tax=Phaeoacremonium minimum (strain UCR-PA7) TaxID=1286976 RepID=R8BAI6_PHAM7|nr:putative leucine rich repeat domain-containing protein [Phaeoacremonium minimum UCRPA7]EON96310.1 putative leucine rich repeat domain-containing protein [Phaeoacremonium minimum UCRPA7]
MAVPYHSVQPGAVNLKVHPADYKTKTMARDHHQQRSGSPDSADRGSFSSIRETDSDLTQAFTLSKVSSYQVPEQAVEELPSPPPMGTMVQAEFLPPLTQPNSKLHGYWFPSESFKGWKQINVRGKLASKSFGDLHMLNQSWSQPSPRQPLTRRLSGYGPGEAPFERLPIEVLSSIINLLVLDVPPNGIARRNVDLMSLLLTSKTLHTATLETLYRHITIPHSRIFHKFLVHISSYPSLGTVVRRLDFSHLNPSTLFSTASERAQARNLTSDTLLQCLELTPYLQEFLAQEYLDDDLDGQVLRKLFLGLDRMKALDFCGCSSTAFKDAFTSTLLFNWPMELPIERLSLHKCMTLPAAVFETLLPRMPRLTHLDVAGTRVTDAALASIPLKARITHLNLAKCRALSADFLIKFLSSHPAVANSLVWLSIASDARTFELFDAEHLSQLIPLLPKTLKSLSLKGSKMNPSHIKQLLPLSKSLEELALGRSLDIKDINGLFVPDEDEIEEQIDWVPHTLRYLDLSDMWGGELDLPTLFGNSCAILSKYTIPLEVVEVADDAARRLTKSPVPLSRAGWRLSELGSRTWIVRNKDGFDKSFQADDGRRSWKMGAESWGMRKIPVARAEVGGMYGSFMFARKL